MLPLATLDNHPETSVLQGSGCMLLFVLLSSIVGPFRGSLVTLLVTDSYGARFGSRACSLLFLLLLLFLCFATRSMLRLAQPLPVSRAGVAFSCACCHFLSNT